MTETKLVVPGVDLSNRRGSAYSDSLSQRTLNLQSVARSRHSQVPFDPKKKLVAQFEDNLHEIFAEQEEREAKDDDSNFSAESFQRKKRMDSKVKKSGKFDLKPTPLGDIDSRDGSGQIEG